MAWARWLMLGLVACSKSSQAPKDAGGPSVDADPSDRVVSSFAFVGGCRVDKADLDPVANPSSANLAELNQTLADLASLPDHPSYLFFVGDLVDNLVAGPDTLHTQLDAWAQIYAASPTASRLTLVPVAGNHEMLDKEKVNGTKIEVSNSAADAVWVAWVAANGFAAHGGNGPTNAAPNSDALQDDERALSYSFDDGSSHFIVLDTDSWTTTPDAASGSTQLGWVPLHWLTADIVAAQANPAITGIYLFGHKPLVAPSGSTASTDAINPALAPQVVQLVDANSKVKGYFTSHAHLWMQTALAGTRGVQQIIAGNGGSSLESAWTEPNPYFGFTVVRTYASGRVGVVSYRRPAPVPYNATTTTAALPQPEIVIVP